MKTLEIAFVPTAGSVAHAYWKNIRLPFFFTWPICKWFYSLFGIRCEETDELKIETVARLKKALDLNNNVGGIEKFYLSGGWSTRSKPIVTVMEEWLMINGLIDENRIITDGKVLQTSDKIENFVKYLKKENCNIIIIHLVTSWYHLRRCEYELRKAVGKNIPMGYVEIRRVPVYPPLTLECLKYEYLYNIPAEACKLLMVYSEKVSRKFAEMVSNWYREKEKKSRGVK